jgi:hypothetical protein
MDGGFMVSDEKFFHEQIEEIKMLSGCIERLKEHTEPIAPFTRKEELMTYEELEALYLKDLEALRDEQASYLLSRLDIRKLSKH